VTIVIQGTNCIPLMPRQQQWRHAFNVEGEIQDGEGSMI
jgi:hypothetical protein